MRALKAAPAPEVRAVGIGSTAVDAAAGPRRDLGLSPHAGDLGDVLVDMPVKRDEREVVRVGNLSERVTAAESRFKRLALGMTADGAGCSHGR